MARIVSFSRLLVRTVGDPALRRLIPIYCGLGILVSIVFGPAGMSSSSVIQGMDVSPRFRIGMWLAWFVLVAGPIRLLFHTRQALYLRSMPVAAHVHWLLLGSLALLIQLPWTWLWLRGDGAVGALTATLTATAVCTLSALTARNWLERFLVLAALAGVVAIIMVDGPWWQLPVASAILFVLAVPAAWQRAPERGRVVDLSRLAAGRLGLFSVYVAAVVRQRSSSLARGAVLTAVGGALTGLIARNNQIVSGSSVTVLALVFTAIMVTMAAAMVVGPVMDAERSMRWLLNATGTSPGRRMLASAVVCAGAAAAYAGVFAGLLIWIAPVSMATAVRVTGAVVFLGACIGMIELRCARWAERPDGIDGARLVSATVGVVLVMCVLLGFLGEWALIAIAGGALKLTFGSVDHTLATPVGRRWFR